MRRYERFSTLLTSNRPVEDWGKLLGDVAAVSAMLESSAASRPCAQLRSTKLAHQDRTCRWPLIPVALHGLAKSPKTPFLNG
ncbi:MAG: ATP-binding protein [Acidobacteriota bacterium]